MLATHTRVGIVEYGRPVDLVAQIARGSGLSRALALQLVIEAGNRIARHLGLNVSPISIETGGVRVKGIAGLLRLSPTLELEIAPKFLGFEDLGNVWREDFLFLSALSQHGCEFTSDRISAGTSSKHDLSALLSHALADMYEVRKRRPLRAYRRTQIRSFSIEGEPDPLEMYFPNSDGFLQETVRYVKQNHWNHIISAASDELRAETSDATAASRLTRIIADLSPQRGPPRRRTQAIPARHAQWRPVYDLAKDVLSGLGMTYTSGLAHAPGYAVVTWKVWENVLAAALRIGFGRGSVGSQRKFVLGSRTKTLLSSAAVPLSVVPDCIVRGKVGFLVDAKYKGNVERGMLRIAEADVYEALAFASATGLRFVILAYPAAPSTRAQTGCCTVFERICANSITVIGIQVDVRGIARKSGLADFATKIAQGFSEALG